MIKYKKIIYFILFIIVIIFSFFVGTRIVYCIDSYKETGSISCGKKEKNNIYIESVDYEINRSRTTVTNELSYILSFDIQFTLNQEFDVNDLVVRIATVKEAIGNKKSFHFDIDYSNTENITYSDATEEFPYILLNYAMVDVTALNAEVQIKITSKDLIDDINNFLQLNCYCESKEIVDKNNILNNGYFKMNYSDDSLVYYEFDEFSESYKVVSVVNRFDSLEVPATYNGYPVRTIGEGAFYGCNNLKSITIPNSVTSIEEDAFKDCYRLVEVYNLSSINITRGSTFNGYLGYYAKVIHLSLSEKSNLIIKEDYLFIKDNDSKYYLVDYDGNETQLILPADINGNPYEINTGAFNYFSSITSVTIPNSVTSIGEYAFEGCNSLTSITIPDSVKSIGWFALQECKNLHYNEYDNGYYLGNEENPYLVLMSAKSKDISTCEINSNTKIIYNSAFSYCDNLKNIVIPDSVINIGWFAFSDCSSLRSVVIGNSVTCIGYYVFSNSSSLTSVTIGNSVTSILRYAFQGCSSLTSITIPNGVTNIEEDVFKDCYRLVEVYNLSSLNVALGSKDNGYLGYYAKIIHKSLSEKSNLITTGDYVFIKDTDNKYYLVDYGGNETQLILPANIDGNTYEINTGAFYDCRRITSVKIPNSVTSIGDFAFTFCNSLTSIVIPDSVTDFGAFSFYDCSSLTSVTISDSVIRISWYAFYGCSSLTNVTIGNRVTRILQYAFQECSSLTSIIIPNSVTIIEDSAFSDCNNLKEVYYKGTTNEWSNISIGNNNSNLTSATIYYYSLSKPTTSGNYWHYVYGVATKW